jgi:hypothetical protein
MFFIIRWTTIVVVLTLWAAGVAQSPGPGSGMSPEIPGKAGCGMDPDGRPLPCPPK